MWMLFELLEITFLKKLFIRKSTRLLYFYSIFTLFLGITWLAWSCKMPMCPESYGDTGRDPHNLPNTISDSKTHLTWDFGQFYSIFLLKNRVKNRVILGNQEYLEIRSNDFCYIVLRVASHIDWRVTTDRLHTKFFIWEFWGL